MSQEERDFPERSAADRPDKTGTIEVELCRSVPTRLIAHLMGGTVHGDSLALEVSAAVEGQARHQSLAFCRRRNGERTCNTPQKLALVELIDHLAHERLIRPGQGFDRLLDLRRGPDRGHGLRPGQDGFAPFQNCRSLGIRPGRPNPGRWPALFEGKQRRAESRKVRILRLVRSWKRAARDAGSPSLICWQS